MDIGAEAKVLRTRRLELLPLTAPVMDAVIAGRADAAAAALGAFLSRWLMDDPTHLVQLRRAAEAAASAGFEGSARVIALSGARRRAIGTIGFHGAPDDAGRLEVACTIHPAHRGRGYGAEAMAALLDWATERFGVTRFLLALPSHRRATNLVPIEMESRRTDRSNQAIEALADLLEGRTPRV